jgi:hypothetical protein
MISGGDILYRGIRLPSFGFHVEFRTRVVELGSAKEAQPQIRVEGKLLMQPRSRIGRFLVRTLLRRPEELGSITYVVRPLAADS